jgi:hypothetical protein
MKIIRATGVLLLILAFLAATLGVISWPPGGLMFALPYVFFMIAAAFGMVGCILIMVGKVRSAAQQKPRS